jgi:hypothetical protein
MVTGRTDNGASKPRGPPCDPLRAVTPLWSAFVRAPPSAGSFCGFVLRVSVWL